MNIKVWDDKYVIKSDNYCYTLREVKQKKAGEDDELDAEETADGTIEVTVAYLSNVAQCFETIVEREGRQNRCTTMDGYIKHLKAINEKLEENLDQFAKIVGGREQLEIALAKLASKA